MFFKSSHLVINFISPQLFNVIQILGHSNVNETMEHVHISTKKITEQMGNFELLLSE